MLRDRAKSKAALLVVLESMEALLQAVEVSVEVEEREREGEGEKREEKEGR